MGVGETEDSPMERTQCDEKTSRPEAARIVRNRIESWRYLYLLGTMVEWE